MPKPTAGRRTSTRKTTASPYGRKMVSNDVSTKGARPNQLSPTKRETYQVATSVPRATSSAMAQRRTATPRSAVEIRKANVYRATGRKRTK